MLYLLIILMIAALAGLAYWQQRQDQAWRNTLPNHSTDALEQHTPSTTQPTDITENTNQSSENNTPPSETQEESVQAATSSDVTHATLLVNDGSTQLYLTETPTEDASEETHRPHPFTLESSEIPEIISDAEATRLVASRTLSQDFHTQFKPDFIIEESNTTAETITDNDPALHRVRQRTLTELQGLRDQPQEELDLADIESVVAENSPIHTDESSDNIATAEPLQTIDIEDIQSNLHRQNQARQHRHVPQNTSHSKAQPNADLPIIPQDEILANLSNNIPAYQRLMRKNRQQETKQPAPTPSNNTPLQANAAIAPTVQAAANTAASSVSIAPAAVFPSHETASPSIAPAAHFQASPATEDTLPWSSTQDYAHENNVQAATEPEQPAPETASDASADTFTEADFAEYYAQQNTPDIAEPETAEPEMATTSHHPAHAAHFALPSVQLLLPAQHNPDAVQSPEELLENSIIIEEKLAEYRVKVKVLDAYAGPVITRYEIEPDVGVRGNSVINLEKDLARSLGVAAIRVVETIPGKTCMGLELPNPKRQMIRLREVFDSEAFIQSASKLTMALGQDISGNPVVTDLAKAPHLLVAGTTGSGKSVGVNSMILSMLYKATPEEVRMIMIDPKMLELSVYEGIPHLLAPVVTDMKLAANALTWCVNEMEKRYRLMSHVGVRNLEGYNQKIAQTIAQGHKIPNPFSLTPDDPEPLEKLPFIVVVVDEFADLMMVAGKQIEQLIARLAQKARAAGIHLILATQRPSVDVITGLIKANIPTRIAFQVSSKIDSRTVLDQMGAENLLGQGDMLFLPPGTGYPQRVHGAFVADNEVHKVVEYWKQFGEPNYVDDILTPEAEEFQFGVHQGERDPLFDQAVEVIVRTKKASVSSLQRHLRIGYNKAATLIDQLEAEGIVSAADHSGKRTILARTQESS